MPFTSEQTAYTFFNVSPTASPYEIDNAYRAATRRYPPDRVWDSPMASVSKTGRQEVDRWYSKISTPDARHAYDAMLVEKEKNKPVFTFEGEAGPSHVKETGKIMDDMDNQTTGAEASEATDGEYGNDDNLFQEAKYDGDTTTGEQEIGEEADKVENPDRDDDNNNNDNDTPFPRKSTPITLDTLDIVTGKAYLYRTRTRTLLALAVLWLAILIIVYGTPSTWPLYTQVSTIPVSSPYVTLGLPEDTSLTHLQIRAAYHRAVLAHHPDKASGSGTESIVEVNSAYGTLREPYSRCLYEHASLVQAWVCFHLKTEDNNDNENEKDVEAAFDTESVSPGAVGRLRTGQVAAFHSLHNMWQRVWYKLAEWLGRVAGC